MEWRIVACPEKGYAGGTGNGWGGIAAIRRPRRPHGQQPGGAARTPYRYRRIPRS